MKVFIPFFPLLLVICTARAYDIALTDGTVLKNARVVQQDDSTRTVTISFSGGVAQVRAAMMPAMVGTAQQPAVNSPIPDTSAPSPPTGPVPTDWTVNGRDYHDVKVTQVEADRVHISYDGGLGTVMLADLPPDLQKRFNYDPVTAHRTAQLRERQASQANAQLEAESARAEASRARAAEMAKHPCYMKGVIMEKVSDGLLVRCDPVTVIADNGDRIEIGQRLPPNLPPGTKQVFGMFLLTHSPNQDSAVDGDPFTIVAYPTGPYSYATVQGSNATIASYTAVIPEN